MKNLLARGMLSLAILVPGSYVLAQTPPPQQDGGQQQGGGDQHGGQQHGGSQHYSGMHDQGQHEGWYKRGGRVPRDYRGGNYVVGNWRDEHLRAPPRGYHWVRSDNGDFLLVAVSTGIIASILAH